MTFFHVLFQKGASINSIVDDIMNGLPNVDCQVSELLEFFRSDFLVLPNESLWMPFDEKIENHSKVSLLIFDFGVYQRALEHFATDTWQNRDDLVTFADQNGSVALTIWITLCGSSQFSLECIFVQNGTGSGQVEIQSGSLGRVNSSCSTTSKAISKSKTSKAISKH